MTKRKELDAKPPNQRAKRQKLDNQDCVSVEGSSSPSSVQGSTPKKAVSRSRPKRLRVRKQARTGLAQKDAEPEPSARAISKTVQAKLQQVLEFHTKRASVEASALERQGINKTQATVTELAAIAAIMVGTKASSLARPLLTKAAFA